MVVFQTDLHARTLGSMNLASNALAILHSEPERRSGHPKNQRLERGRAGMRRRETRPFHASTCEKPSNWGSPIPFWRPWQLANNAIFHIISNKNCWGRIYCHNHSRQNLTLNSALQYLFCLSAHSSSFPFSRHQTAPVEHHYHQEKGPKFALAERAEGLQYLPQQIKEDEWRPTQSHTSSWWPRSRPMTLKPRCILVASNPHIPEGEGQQLTLAQHLSTQAHQQLLDKGAHLSLTRQ